MKSLSILSTICLVVALVIGAGLADDTMKNACRKAKENGVCDRPNGKAQCPDECGGGGGGDGGDKTEATTKKPTTTTKKSTTTTASKKKKCDKRSPCESMAEANAGFLQRCQASALPPPCHQHCRYDEDQAQLKKAFMGGPCPLGMLRDYLTCASAGKNNEPCCVDSGVTSQKKTEVCGCFCNPTGPVWPGKGETMKYAPCVGVLQGIMQCHYYAQGAD